MFLGYPAYTRGYRVLILGTNKIVETCEVSFDEASPGTRPDIAGTLSQVQGEDGRIFEDESDNDNDDDEVGSADQTAGTPPVRQPQDERSDWRRWLPDLFMLIVMVLERLQLRPVRVQNVKQLQKSLLLCIFNNNIRRNKSLVI